MPFSICATYCTLSANKLLTRRPFGIVPTVHFVQKMHLFCTHSAASDTLSTYIRAVQTLSIFGNEEVGSSNLLISSISEQTLWRLLRFFFGNPGAYPRRRAPCENPAERGDPRVGGNTGGHAAAASRGCPRFQFLRFARHSDSEGGDRMKRERLCRPGLHLRGLRRSVPCGEGAAPAMRKGRRQSIDGGLSVSKKWRNATFSSFHRFCLSHSLPGGKTCKVRNPPGFHPF